MPRVPTQRTIPNPAGYPTIIYIGGIQATPLVRIKNLTITDVLNEQPNTATLTVNILPHNLPSPPFHPPSFDAGAFNVTPSPSIYPNIRRGQPIEIYSGGQSLEQLIFAGEIVTVRQIYEADVPANVALHLSCTDHTRALNRRKVTKSYGTQSVTGIVQDLMTTFAASGGFTTQYVQTGLPPIAIDFTFEAFNRALTRLANRIGAYWYVDYTKALHFFLDEPGATPAPLVPGGVPFADLQVETDLSQVRTRVVVEGAGSAVSTQVKVGETMIPVRDPVMFPATGGLAIVGQQRLSYTGVQVGDQGALVGPGAQPGAALVASGIVGAGIEVGTHDYAVTYQTASGESLPSPIARVTLGIVDPPSAPPTPTAPTAGNGPNPGTHYYAVAFITATGETPVGPAAGVTTTQAGGVPAPGASAAALRNVVGNLQAGVPYRYATTVTTASGETIGGAPSAAITPAAPPAPTSVTLQAPTTINQAGGGIVDGTTYNYYLSYVAGSYETGFGSAQVQITARNPTPPGTIPPNAPQGAIYGAIPTGGGPLITGTYYYGVSWVYGAYESALGYYGGIAVNNNYGEGSIALGISQCPDVTRCTGVKLWRSKQNIPGTLYLVATLPNPASSGANYNDAKADANLGAVRPHWDPIGTPPSTTPPPIALYFPSFTPSPNPKVTGMKLWRYVPGTNEYRLVTTFSNASVAYTDASSDAALGASRGLNTGPIGTAPGDQANVTIPTSADPRAVGRKVYRSDAGAAYRYLTTVNNNSATQIIDNTASVSANPDLPTTDSTGGALTCVVPVVNIPLGPASVTGRKLYRTAADGGQLLLLATIANNTATTYTDTKTDSTLGQAPPATNSTMTQQVALAAIPVGPVGVTARKLYRSAANTTPLRALTTLANNTQTTYTDAAGDATLGAAVPTLDTSALQQPPGQVNAGATTIPVSATAGFAAGGGFAVVGNGEQVIRYTGLTVNTLTGVPASGPGALTATVPYNSSVTNAPALLGVPASGPGSIAARSLVDGEEIHLLIERNDLPAQTALAAIEGGDGIIEHYIQDRRLSAAGATATADAELALFKNPETRVTYTTRDVQTRSGRTVAINLPAPTNVVGEFLIQQVQITQFDLPGLPPLRAVQASSTRFSFEDLLRRLELEISA